MKRNYLLAAILVATLLLSLRIGSFMDASAQVLDTPTVKPILKATNTPQAKPTNTPANKYIL
jgi:hypothetical protein